MGARRRDSSVGPCLHSFSVPVMSRQSWLLFVAAAASARAFSTSPVAYSEVEAAAARLGCRLSARVTGPAYRLELLWEARPCRCMRNRGDPRPVAANA